MIQSQTYWVQNDLPKVTESSIIEYTVPCDYDSKTIDVFTVGLSKQPHWDYTKREDKRKWFTFLKDGKEVFGNAHKYRSLDDVLGAITDKVKYSIQRNKSFIPKLKIDGKEIIIFHKVN